MYNSIIDIDITKGILFLSIGRHTTSTLINKIILLPLNRLQNKAVRTREYDKTKTAVLCYRNTILNIADLFNLSAAKFMYSFYNGGLPNHFDNYFTEIASVHKYQTRFADLQKYYFPKMKRSAFFKV